MPSATGLQVTGMKEFRKGLRAAGGPAMTKWVAAGHKAIATEYLGRIQSRGRSVYQPSGSIAKALSARGSQTAARIALSPFKDPRIFGAEFGAFVHKVWGRGMPASQMKGRVFPPWGGNQFVGGEPGSGVGSAVFPVLKESQIEITADYLSYIERAFYDAFPERG